MENFVILVLHCGMDELIHLPSASAAAGISHSTSLRIVCSPSEEAVVKASSGFLRSKMFEEQT